MKKNFLIKFFYSALFFCLLAGTSSWADSELDRRYTLERIGFLKSWDNVDGLFADYVKKAYFSFFEKKARFKLQDISEANSVLANSKIEYRKLIEDEKVLSQLTRTMHVESVIRTKIYKEGPTYRFVIDWLHAPKMHILATLQFVYKESKENVTLGAKVLEGEIHKALEKLVSQVGWIGHVNGRDDKWITVNIGKGEKLEKGEVLVLATVESVKVHPLLNKLVDWTFIETGRVEVDEIDERIAFTRLYNETEGRQITRFQKVVKVLPADVLKKGSAFEHDVSEEELEAMEAKKSRPQLGWVQGGPTFGSFSRQYSVTTDTGRSGSGFLIGAGAEGQLWLTKNVFSELGFGFGFMGYSQGSIGRAQSDSSSASLTNFRIALGYNYLLNGKFFGPKGWLRLGYRSSSYGFAVSSPNFRGPTSFSAIILGIGGEMDIRSDWRAQLDINVGLLGKGFEASGYTTTAAIGVTDFSFYAGALYKFKPRLAIKGGFEIMAQGADFAGGSTLTHRVITFLPSLLYYF